MAFCPIELLLSSPSLLSPLPLLLDLATDQGHTGSQPLHLLRSAIKTIPATNRTISKKKYAIF
jgi:hypothetical protein